ncbi:dihydrofolate reductase family protein [Streptomyces sp. NPDC058045]|uniref:dihydrofolate reductase family protein n=1 Tax=Streptomyces sp. NPDC058045 TaxID=3346311 RepID=UPI0036ECFD4B
MGQLTADVTISLDGYVTGAHPSPTDEAFARTGAVIVDQDVFRTWTAESSPLIDISLTPPAASGGTGTGDALHQPVFVLFDTPRRPFVTPSGTIFHFVPNGLVEAVRQARSAAGFRDMVLAAGTGTVQQAVLDDLLDELRLHIAPEVLGSGTRLFSRLGEEYVVWDASLLSGDSGTVHLTVRLRDEAA